jgi:hypothetical protein
MRARLLQALTALPLWAGDGMVGSLFAVVGGVYEWRWLYAAVEPATGQSI